MTTISASVAEVSSQQREDIWRSLLEAETNDCAWSDEAKRYGSYSRFFSIGTSVLSSSTVLALFTVPEWHSIAGKLLAALASIASILHSALYSPARLKQIAALAGEWKKLAIDCRLLWSELQSQNPDAEQWKRYQNLCAEEKKIDESGFRLSTGKMRAAQNTIKRKRGLLHER